MVVKSKNSQVELEELQGFKLIEKFRKLLQSPTPQYSRPPHTVLTKSQMERSLYNYEVIEYLRLSEILHL